MEVITSTPGKILWIGGYSVLEKGNISFVTGVSKRVYAHVRGLEGNKIVVNIPQFNTHLEGTFEGTKIVFDKGLSDAEKDASKFVKCAVENCLRYLQYRGKQINGVETTTISDPAFGTGGGKTGLGASAAVTVATTAALFELHGIKVEENKDLIHKMAQYIHFRVQGKVGSGFDVSASTFGGHAYSRFSPELIKDLPEDASIEVVANAVEGKWDYSAESLKFPQEFIPVMGNLVGESSSTSAMVKKVNEFKAASPDKYKAVISMLNNANLEAVEYLRRINALWKTNPAKYNRILVGLDERPDLSDETGLFNKFKEAFNKGRLLTKQLGELSGAPIEPDEYTRVIEETMKNGAFIAKLPGAGGGDAIAAICLSWRSKKRVEEFWRGYTAKKIEPIPLSVSNEGVRIESPAAFEQMKNLVR